MTEKVIKLSPEEEARVLLRWVIPNLPDAVGRRLLADNDVLSTLGLPAGDFLQLWNHRFGRSDLLACVRAVANGAQASLSSFDNKIQIEEARLDDDGFVALRVGKETIRFPNVGLMSDDLKVRKRALDVVIASGEVSSQRERVWRALIRAGPLDDDQFLELERELGLSPEAAYREIAASISHRGATFSDLVPLESRHYASLLNIPPPPSLDEFKAAWVARAVRLDRKHLARLLKLSGPLSIVSGGLLAQTSDKLSDKARLDVVESLKSSPDPFSVVAAFEIACRHHADAEMRSIADTLLGTLLNPSDPLIEDAAVTLGAAIAVTTALTARDRVLAPNPLYAKRLASFLHASHLLRVFLAAQVDPTLFINEVARTFVPQARLADLCDTREAPNFQMRHWGAPLARVLILSRVAEAIARLSETERPPAWVESKDLAIANAVADNWGVFVFSPEPFDEFDEKWNGLTSLPLEDVEEMRTAFESAANHDRSISDLIKLSIALDIAPEQRPALVLVLPQFIESLTGTNFLLAAEIGLQLAARWRDEGLSDRLIDILLAHARDEDLADASASPRLVLLAAAAVEDRKLWLQRAGNVAQAFAYANQPGAPSINLMRALDLLHDFEPELASYLGSAKAYTVLAFNRLPTRKSGAEQPTDQAETSDEEGSQSDVESSQ